jgi:hypothetical protein
MITIRLHDGVETRFELVEDDRRVLWIRNGPHRRHVLCHALRELGWSIVAADPADQARLDAAGLWSAKQRGVPSQSLDSGSIGI